MKTPRRHRRKPEDANHPASVSVSATPRSSIARTVLIAGFLAAIVFIVFFPCLQNGFVYDDEDFLLRNAHFRGLGWQNIRWMFTTFHYGHYQPLSWMTLGLDYVIWGMNPWGYHLTNLLLHATNALFVFLLARRLIYLADRGRRFDVDSPAMDLAAAVAALFFAIHPLRVESVAWITDRNDLLSSTFLLLSVLFYLSYNDTKGRRSAGFLTAAVAAYFFSLMTRATSVALPLALVALDYYPLRRFSDGRFWGRELRRVWLEKIPFVLLSVAAAALAPIAKGHAGLQIGLLQHGIGARIAQACFGLVFYIYKSLLPINLSPIYELNLRIAAFAPKYLISGSIVLAATLMIGLLRRRYPALTTVAICYIVFLLPVLGFVQFGMQEVADRYSYLPMIGWAILVGGIIVHSWRKMTRRPLQLMLAALTMLTAVMLGTTAWRQCFVWRDSLSLWHHAVAHGPPSGIAHFNYANALIATGNREAAIVHFRKAIDILPSFRDARHNLSNCLTELGRYEEAISGFQQTLLLDPNFAKAYYGMGYCYERQGKFDYAIVAYRNAIRCDPRMIKSYIDLGAILLDQKRHYDESVDLYHQALAIDPNQRDIHYSLGIAFETMGKTEEAVAEFRKTIHIDSASSNAHLHLGDIFARQGRINDAVAEYREALRINPNQPAAKANLEGLIRSQSTNR